MGSCPDEEKLLLAHHSPKPRKGGLRTIPFIIVNESFERLASIGLTPNMVFYLMNDYHMEITTVSTIFSLWSALSNGLSIFGAFIADSYFGRFRVIIIGSFSSLLGMIMLWLTTMFPQLRPLPCDGNQLEMMMMNNNNSSCSSSSNYSATAGQLAFLLSSYLLISIGAGCIRPCSTAFGIDQLKNKGNDPNNERLLQSFINWYNVATSIASVVALTIIVYIQEHYGWQIGFAIPAILMLVAFLIVLLGSSLFIKAKASKSLFTGLIQVVVVAFKNRNLSLPVPPPPVLHNTTTTTTHHDHGYYFYHHQSRCDQSNFLAPTDNLRCLNKACIVRDPERDLNAADGSASNPWNLCTVEQVESLKALVRLIPMWTTGIMLIVSMYQNSFSTLQANTMDRHLVANFEIPAASFSVVMVLSIIVWLSFYDRVMVPLVLARYTGDSRGLSSEARLAISLLLSSMAMAVSAVVEAKRRGMVIEQGLEDDPQAKVNMSAMWLLPQYAMMGVADCFSTTAQVEFFYTHLPKQMSSVAMALYTLELAAASLVGAALVNIVNGVTGRGGDGNISWLASNINKGHIDYYYWMIACLGFLNFVYFLICLRAYGHSNYESSTTSNLFADDDDDQVDG